MIYTHGFLPQQQCMTSHLPATSFSSAYTLYACTHALCC